MTKYIVLLRGVNVGGNNKLPMKDLKFLLIKFGFYDVQTYIQSGNIILSAQARPDELVSELINTHFGFKPNIMSFTELEFEQVYENNPYADKEGKLAHIYFCNKLPSLNLDNINKWISDSESYQLIGKTIYLSTPDGIGRSKLVENIEKCLGVSATGRNLNTINKLYGMLKPSI